MVKSGELAEDALRPGAKDTDNNCAISQGRQVDTTKPTGFNKTTASSKGRPESKMGRDSNPTEERQRKGGNGHKIDKGQQREQGGSGEATAESATEGRRAARESETKGREAEEEAGEQKKK